MIGVVSFIAATAAAAALITARVDAGPVSPSSTSCGACDPVIDAEDKGIVDSPALIKGLSSTKPHDRIKAATALGRIQLPQVVDPLINLFTSDKEHDQSVISTAAFAMGQLGYDPTFNGGRVNDLLNALVSKLPDPSTDDHAYYVPNIIEAIAKLAASNTTALVSPHLASKSKHVRKSAIFALYIASRSITLPKLDNSTIQLLQNMYAESDVTLRQGLALLVSRLKDAGLKDLALTLVKDSNEFVRAFAIPAIGSLGTFPSSDASVLTNSVVKDSSEHVRVAALKTISTAQPALLTSTHGLLDTAAADKSFHVRSVLASILPPTTPSALWNTLLKDASATVRASAVTGYAAAFSNSSVSTLMDVLQNDAAWQVRAAAVNAAATLSNSLADPIFQFAINDKAPQVVYSVFEAYAAAPYETSWILPYIFNSSLTAPHLYLRISALDAMTVLPASIAATAQQIITAFNASFTPTPRSFKDARQELVDLLGTLKNDTTAIAGLMQALQDPYTEVSNDARAALTAQGYTNLPPSPQDALELCPYRNESVRDSTHVELTTSKGRMVIQLYLRDAPITARSFLGLVKSGFYDGLTWHRVVDNFVIQGGDSDGFGYGDGTYSVRAEINEHKFVRGTVGMPRSTAFSSGGCQLFINHVPTPSLDGKYTVFGQVVEGLDVIDLIEVGDLIIKARAI